MENWIRLPAAAIRHADAIVTREIRHITQGYPDLNDRRSPARIGADCRAWGQEGHGGENFLDHCAYSIFLVA